MFRDCSISDFEDIFSPEYNPHLPLYVNLWILREQYAYFSMVDSVANKNAVPWIIGLNTVAYYFLRKINPGTTIRYAKIPRTLFLTALFNFVGYTMFA